MKHFGIWIPENGSWLFDGNGIVFSTTCKIVASVQLQFTSRFNNTTLEIKEFTCTPEGLLQR